MRCVNNGDYKVAGEEFSVRSIQVKIEVKIADKYCVNTPEEAAQCQLDPVLERSLAGYKLLVLTNFRRFVAEEYSSETPLIEESEMAFLEIPMS